MRKPYGLTGGIGCGKSTVAKILEASGCVVYSCDTIAKEIILDPHHRQEIIKILGTDTPFEGASVDKRMIAEIVFSSQEIKKAIEGYVHPLVWGIILWRMEFLPKDTLVFIESALVYEIGWANKFEAVLVVTCSEEEQVRRLKSIRGMSDQDIVAFMYTQLSSHEKELRGDYVISTECSEERLEQRVNELCLSLKQINQKEKAQ